LPALAVPAAAVASTQPDPIFAAIEVHRQADDAHQKAVGRYFQAESDFVDEFGASTPNAFSKKLREGWAAHKELEKFSKARVETHAEVAKLNAIWPRDVVAGLHRELNRQTEIFNQRVEPLRIASAVAGEAAKEASTRLMSTRPTTLAGLAAVTAYLRDGNQLIESILYDDDHMNDFLDMVGEVMRSVKQS